MKKEDYLKLVEEKSYKENKMLNIFTAFIIGGLVAVFSQAIILILENCSSLSTTEIYVATSIILVTLSAIFTGFGFFDKVVSFAKCGFSVPVTGFAHSMTSAAMDYKKEGFVKGMGANIFKLTGSVILYGILFAFIAALIRGYLI